MCDTPDKIKGLRTPRRDGILHLRWRISREAEETNMRAYERFLEYVKINTQSNEDSGTHPSFPGEFDLAKKLVDELDQMGIKAELDDKCYVMAKLDATKGYEDLPTLGLIAHMDTAPAYSGCDIKPIIRENYDGGDVVYPCGKIMKTDDFPHLKKLAGQTLITSDGTTLLGVDDKAGVSEIMTAIETIIKEERPHGPLAIAFTPDEEIGEGADNFDVEKFGATYAYTVDGGDVDAIEYENFNAADAVIVIHGVSVHPGTAKGVMINAANVAHEFHAMLPENMRPEHTEGYEGFYHLTDITADCVSAKLHYIVRNHDKKLFEDMKKKLEECAGAINDKYGEGTAQTIITDSYYNMLDMIKPHMHLIDAAKNAIRSTGLKPVEVPIRGGTDGARLSYMGLPCPNLGTGGFNYHGPFECTTAERMDKATEVILNIIHQMTFRQ